MRVINIPTTVEELKAEFHDLEPVNEPVVEQEFISEVPKKRGRTIKIMGNIYKGSYERVVWK